jgi:cytidyltransferase-like protein
VLATGVFDIFHTEHRLFLEKAKDAGDVLVVGLESDKRVRTMKGPTRPIVSEYDRWKMVQGCAAVDATFVLPETFSEQAHFLAFIQTLRPHVLAVSSHTNHLENKQSILQSVGGEVQVVHKHNNRVSTTLLVTDELGG